MSGDDISVSRRKRNDDGTCGMYTNILVSTTLTQKQFIGILIMNRDSIVQTFVQMREYDGCRSNMWTICTDRWTVSGY